MNELYLAHHGIKGQKWGVRRFQNEDGSLTSAGRKRYGDSPTSGPKRNFPTKKVIAGALAGATIATAAVLYVKNPAAVNAAMRKVGNMSVNAVNSVKDRLPSYKNALGEYRTTSGHLAPRGRAMTDLERATIASLKEHDRATAKNMAIRGVKSMPGKVAAPFTKFGKGVKDGLTNGIRNAPTNMGKMLGEGAIALVGMTAVNQLLGEATTGKMITAYNNGKSKDKKYKNVKLDQKSFAKQMKKDFSPRRRADDDDDE